MEAKGLCGKMSGAEHTGFDTDFVRVEPVRPLDDSGMKCDVAGQALRRDNIKLHGVLNIAKNDSETRAMAQVGEHALMSFRESSCRFGRQLMSFRESSCRSGRQHTHNKNSFHKAVLNEDILKTSAPQIRLDRRDWARGTAVPTW